MNLSPGTVPPSTRVFEKGVNQIIAGGMGQKAQHLFAANNVQVITGARGECPRDVVENYLRGTLVTGANACDH